MNEWKKLGAGLLVLAGLWGGMSDDPAEARSFYAYRSGINEGQNPFPDGKPVESTLMRRLMHETAYTAALEWYGRRYGAYPKTSPAVMDTASFKNLSDRRIQEQAARLSERSKIIGRLSEAHFLQLQALSSLRQDRPDLLAALADRRIIDKWQLFKDMENVSGSVPHVSKSIQWTNAAVDQESFGIFTILAIYLVNDHPEAFAEEAHMMDSEKAAKVQDIRRAYENYAKTLLPRPAPAAPAPRLAP